MMMRKGVSFSHFPSLQVSLSPFRNTTARVFGSYSPLTSIRYLSALQEVQLLELSKAKHQTPLPAPYNRETRLANLIESLLLKTDPIIVKHEIYRFHRNGVFWREQIADWEEQHYRQVGTWSLLRKKLVRHFNPNIVASPEELAAEEIEEGKKLKQKAKGKKSKS
eukprot:TRINITY_DN1356_c0_g1_i1.p1 TRINITY_DN1356_c0_g1~~TRINITY_DN1356_c0_g1_i1.p1  ORF type:complete len:165 (-),score=33.85 TRINITY_DN1356_c0_g1_i1:104-598(-)